MTNTEHEIYQLGYRTGYDAGAADMKNVAKQLQDALDKALAENLAMRDKLAAKATGA